MLGQQPWAALADAVLPSTPNKPHWSAPTALTTLRDIKAAVHWVRVSALSAESSPRLTWDSMGLRADSAR